MHNTIQLPPDLYDAVQKKASIERKSADDLVAEWVSARIEEPEPSESTSAFEREVAAFERMKPALLQKYPGQYVAIYQGEVIEIGNEKIALLQKVRDKFGPIICYIEKVDPDSPRTVRMPSAYVVRS